MTSATPNTRPAGFADDTGSGLLIFLVFTAAVLVSTGAVALIALVGTWWMLGFGFAIHVAMTTLVVLTIIHVMDGRARAIRDRDRPSPSPNRRLEGRPQTHPKPMTAL